MTRILQLCAALILLAMPARAESLLVFAAASLAGPLDDAVELWEEETGQVVVVSYAGSSALARQIEAGAPADVFLSANEGWMDHLAALSRIDNASRRNLWGNRLVLVSHAEGDVFEITETTFLPALIGDGRLAVGMVEAVPAGVYALEALRTLGSWDGLKDQLAQADNVRAALSLVATGAAPWGIVYATDAMAEPRVHLRSYFPTSSHSAITYPAAHIQGGDPSGLDFLAFLQTPPVRELFEEAGFQTVPAP
ncbi:molybdate ABC transporter substrate-binding protein [Pseudooceanicola sp. MF1-13]|uniref:molybdate ABC transporter substrate-binding protein n=1 Tax=Pseudooceanicola sp. MF1-13 TaxID=3379095 RepID=UPI00389298D9